MAPLLKVKVLRKDFFVPGRKHGSLFRAVDGVDLEIDAGETFALVGESGCGKTTLARCVLRLLEPSSGSIEFDGTDLHSLSPAALRRKRREFQMVFQDPLASLDPLMTVKEILLEPFQAQEMGTSRERAVWVEELLELAGLDPTLASRRPALLSGGQQQRVGIARALALKPRLLVADEPVSALDASVQVKILNLLADLQKRYQLTLFLISHSLPVVRYLATRLAVMRAGRIVEESPADSFFAGPNDPYSQALLGSTPVLDR
jgi:ABC-type oligopeptide transport system ATPase subunit